VKRTHGRIAEEADNPAHGAGLVIVIDLLGFSSDGAQSTLLPNELIDLVGAYAVAPHQVVVAFTSPIVASQRLTTLLGMTWFAVAVVAGLGVLVPREIRWRF
jgi:hypothetical protein